MTQGRAVVGREAERLAIDHWLAGPRPSALLLAGEAGIGFHDALAAPRRTALAAACGRIIADREQPPGTDLIGLAVADLLRALDRRVLLAIDDLQWMDEPNAPGARVCPAPPARSAGGPDRDLAYRPHDAPDRLDLVFDQRERIDVGPLSVTALGRLIRDRLGAVHSRPLLMRIHEACGGNAFLALEISRSLLGRSTEPAPGEPFPVPPDTGALVRDHLAALSGQARRCVLLVAMSPNPRLDVIQRILGAEGATAIEEAWAKGILYADGDRLVAQHPLFTSIAHADASPVQRRALRKALAEHTEDVVERAVHLCAMPALSKSDTSALAEAGALAMARGAPGVAATLLERAGLLVEAAEAAVAAGDPEKAESYLGTLLERTPSGKTRAIALLALGEMVYVQRPNDALPLLVEALAHTEGDPALEALAHSHIAAMADMDPTVGHRSAERAAVILEPLQPPPDPEHLACALLGRAFHRLLRGEPPSNADIDRALRCSPMTCRWRKKCSRPGSKSPRAGFLCLGRWRWHGAGAAC
jgi:hypothetical protein